MQCKDIPDEVAIQAARDVWRLPESIEHPSVVDLIVERTGAPEKVAYTKLRRLCDRGLLESGVSIRWCWPVEK